MLGRELMYPGLPVPPWTLGVQFHPRVLKHQLMVYGGKHGKTAAASMDAHSL